MSIPVALLNVPLIVEYVTSTSAVPLRMIPVLLFAVMLQRSIDATVPVSNWKTDPSLS